MLLRANPFNTPFITNRYLPQKSIASKARYALKPASGAEFRLFSVRIFDSLLKPGSARITHRALSRLRYGTTGAAGAAPAVWSTLMSRNARTAVPIDGLTPGTTYAVQVRAYGQLGYTEWSASATRMCI